jgi:hypothetical protein
MAETRCCICKHLFLFQRPILNIGFYLDGEIFMDCGIDSEVDPCPIMEFKPVGLNHMFDRDETLLELFPPQWGFGFYRDHIGADWVKYEVPKD